MRIPRDVSSKDIIRVLSAFGYEVTRQTGSHIRLTTSRAGEHHVTIPNHDPIRIGTLSAILTDVAAHLGIDREELVDKLIGR